MADDLASLKVTVDATSADKSAASLGRLHDAAAKAEIQTGKLGDASKRTGVTVEQAERYMNKASIRLKEMADAERKAAADADKLKSSMKGASDAAQEMANESRRGAASAGAYRSGMQNLGFQMQDFAVQVAGGTSATRAFAQQMPQAIGAMQLMFGNTSKLGAFLGGPWGVALGVAAASLGPLLTSLLDTTAATDELREAEKRLADSIGTLISSREALDRSLGKNIGNYITLRVRALEAAQAELKAAQDSLTASRARLAAAQADQKVRDFNLQSPEVAAAGGFFNPFGFGGDSQIRSAATDLKNNAAALNEASAALNNATADLNRALKAEAPKIKETSRATDVHTQSIRAKTKAISDEERERQRASAAADSYIAQLKDEIERIGKTDKELRLLNDSRAMAAAVTDKQREAIQLLSDQRELAIGVLELAREAEKKAADEAKKAAKEAAEATAMWNEQVDALLSSLYRLGGVGGILGDIGGILTSKNPIASMLGMGGVGTVVGSIFGGKSVTDQMGAQFGQALHDVFGVKGELAVDIGNVMGRVFQGAAVGGAVSSVMGGGKGGAIGGQIGGALGGMVTASSFGGALSFLGGAAGPIGAIAGAILGNVLGSALQSTKRGGATINASGISGTWGNSDQRIGAASDLGNSALGALTQIADALGVKLGSFSSSISVRENNLRFDPTGSGISKTSKGAINFGQDEKGLVEAFFRDAIADGAFNGLAQGFKDYLSSGDAQARLTDVLNVKTIQDEAAQRRDPQAAGIKALDAWREQMLVVFSATGQDLADLEYVYGERRKEILAAANDNALEIERERTGLLIQIAEMEGRSTEALAMARDLERGAADESLRPLYDRIYALQDEANAAATAAQNAAEVARWAQANNNLVVRLYELQGKASDALALQRAMEIDATEESLRPLLRRIHVLEDEKTAADEAARAAAEAAAALKAIADERFGLETRLLQLQGDTNALRQRELDALDPTNRALLEFIFALEDLKAEADKAKVAADALAASQKAIADERYNLETQLLTLQGKTDELRERSLLLLDPSNRALQEQIWALQDQEAAAKAAAEAQQAYASALASAHSALADAYERERSELEQTRDKFRDLSATIRDFRLGLSAANDNNARLNFFAVAASAQQGNEGAANAFAGAATTYLDSSRRGASTRQDYQRAVSIVERTALTTERALTNREAEASRQIQLLEKRVEQWIDVTDIKDGVLSVDEAIKNLVALQSSQLPAVENTITLGLQQLSEQISMGNAGNMDMLSQAVATFGYLVEEFRALKMKVEGIKVEGGAIITQAAA